MSIVRRTIRNRIVSALSDVYAERVVEVRSPVIDDDETSVITVFFEEGEVEYDGVYAMTSSVLIVGFHRRDVVTDDDLDEWTDPVPGILEALAVEGVYTSAQIAGFEYGDDDSGEFSSLLLRFNLNYSMY